MQLYHMSEEEARHVARPRGMVARTCVKRWMLWAGQHWSPALAMDGGPAELARAAVLLDRHLSGRDWLVGDCATLADYAVAAPLMHRDPAGLPLDGYPQLLAWYARVRALSGAAAQK